MSSKHNIGDGAGPYDIDDLATDAAELANSHLDLGSVLVPVVEGGQVTVEMSPDHQPEAVYLVTPVGRIGVHAFAAPRSGGLWRQVVRELSESLRAEGAQTDVEDGHWGREVVARVPGGEHRFIGVDGPRWMVRCVASGPDGDSQQLAQLARAVLAESVVRRGKEPFPPRDVLPIVLPAMLAEQVAAAQQQMMEEQSGAPTSSPMPEAPQPSPQSGSAQSGSAQSGSAQPDFAAVDDVVPGGAVEQAAAATVFTEEPAAAAEVVVEDETPAAPSEGSAMQRLRGRRRRR